jgi:4-diphosphocytidyl-2-C-methyl-D-erythritol kinase
MPTRTLRLQAPAKVNLFLRVLGRRPDGFHELETLFERIDLADELSFEPADELSLQVDHPELGAGPENLVLRAATMLRHASGARQGARIRLVKQVPLASGLGGGSSDAATTLVGLNQLWDLRWPRPRLQQLAAQLGSDVPFFLEDQPFAVGRGRGERCEPVFMDFIPLLWHVLIVPPVGLSTKDVYQDYARDGETSVQAPSALTPPEPSISMCLHALRNGSLGELAPGLWNSLAHVAIRRCPVIQEILAQLRDSGCTGALMSGSGPSVFGLCHDADHARAVVQRLGAFLSRIRDGRPDLASRPWVIRVVRTCHGSSPWASCGS